MLKRVVTHPATERVVLALIILNAATLGLETFPAIRERYGEALAWLDHAVLAVFVVELAARMAVHRARFLRDPWSLFDLFVVAIALVPTTDSLSVLRALRILRALRLITAVPSLKRVVGGLITALPGMGSILLLLCLIFFVFSVISSKLYGEAKPELFGDLFLSAYTLFQVMTFDDWSGGVVKPLLETHPFASLFFIAFMLLSSFMVLNLFIGVVVTALDSETGEDAPKIGHPNPTEQRLLDEIAALRRDIAGLHDGMSRKGEAAS